MLAVTGRSLSILLTMQRNRTFARNMCVLPSKRLSLAVFFFVLVRPLSVNPCLRRSLRQSAAGAFQAGSPLYPRNNGEKTEKEILTVAGAPEYLDSVVPKEKLLRGQKIPIVVGFGSKEAGSISDILPSGRACAGSAHPGGREPVSLILFRHYQSRCFVLGDMSIKFCVVQDLGIENGVVLPRAVLDDSAITSPCILCQIGLTDFSGSLAWTALNI